MAKDKDPRLPPLESEGLPSSSSSSSERSRLDLSLEAIFDEMGSAQRGINSGVRQINSKVDQLASDSKLDRKDLGEIKKLIGQVRIGYETIADRLRDLTLAIERNSNVTIDKKNADLAIGDKIDQRLEKIQKNITGSFPVASDDEDTAPKLRIIAVWVADLGWKHRKKVIAVVGTIATAAWTYAAPSIIDAIKLFFRGS